MAWKDVLIKSAGVATSASLLAGCAPGNVDAYNLLAQECGAGQGDMVGGELIAVATFNLAPGQSLNVGANTLGDPNVLTVLGDGGVSIKSTNSDVKPEYLTDGRISLNKIEPAGKMDERMAVSIASKGSLITSIQVTLDCKDQTKIPPIVQTKNGFYPGTHSSKPSPASFNGYRSR